MCLVSCLLCIICYCICLSRTEHLIRSGHIPSYLEASTRYVDEDPFPSKLTINMSITKFTGTLLHTVDHNNNEVQILLSEEGDDQFFTISLNANSGKVNWRNLCSCATASCTSIVLVLRTHNHVEYSLKCNDGVENVQRFTGNGKPKNNFWILEQRNVQSLIWLVNTPDFGAIRSNAHQMEGSIYNVEYNGNSMQLKSYGDAIVDPNIKVCTDNICNGGICHETHSDEPICDCATVFGSGRRCVDESRNINGRFNQRFQFSKIKISWRSEVSNIFEIGNRKLALELKMENTDFIVVLKRNGAIVNKGSVMMAIKRNMSYVLTVSIGKFMEFKFLSGEGMMLNIGIRNVSFDYLILSSGSGVIDVAYKTNESDNYWKKWQLNNSTMEPLHNTSVQKNVTEAFQPHLNGSIQPNLLNGISNTDNKSNSKEGTLNVPVLVLVPITFALLLAVIILIVKLKNRSYGQPQNAFAMQHESDPICKQMEENDIIGNPRAEMGDGTHKPLQNLNGD